MPQPLFTRLRHWWARPQGGSSPAATTASAAPTQLQGLAAGAPAAADANPTPPVPYDEALLDRARTQWQFGDWAALAGMTQEQIQHHPDRAKLALLAAAGLQQLGETEPAKALTRQALDWGCSPRLVRQILISGMHNSLARANAILGQEQEAMKHFEAAIDTGTPNADRLVKAARVTFQLNQVGVPVTFQIGWTTTTQHVIRTPPQEARLAAPIGHRRDSFHMSDTGPGRAGAVTGHSGGPAPGRTRPAP